jgi:PAS domain S-box-containing protein
MSKVPSEFNQELRQRAEELFRAAEDIAPDLSATVDVKKLLHELQVHQIELELQNEELRRVQFDLESSQERYIELYDLAPIGYLTLNHVNLIEKTNLAAAKLLGAARSTLFKQPISAYLFKEDQIIFYQQLKECSASAPVQKVELRMLRADGQMFWAHVQVTAAQNGEYWLVVTDISQRKLAALALEEREALYRGMLEYAPEAIILYDTELALIVDANKKAEELFGCDREMLLKGGPERFFSAIQPGNKTVAESMTLVIAQTLAGEEPVFERLIHSVGGRTKCCEARTVRMPYTQRNLLRGSFIDITQRKRNETYLEVMRAVLEILNNGDTVRNTLHLILDELKTRLGFDAVGVRLQQGEDFPYFAHLGFSPEFLHTANTLVERTADGEICRGADGSAYLECTCGLIISGYTDSSNPLFTAGGSFWTNDASVLVDMPHREVPGLRTRCQCLCQGEASVALIPIRVAGKAIGLLHLNDRRKDSFSLKTVELLERISAHIGEFLLRKQGEKDNLKLAGQLQQAQKMEAIGILAGGKAHNFNNNLSIILGNIEMVNFQKNLTTETQEFLHNAKIGVFRSRDLIKQMMAYSRSENEKVLPIQLGTVINETLTLLRPMIPTTVNLQYNATAQSLAATVIADATRVQEAVLNLCNNAVHAMDETGQLTIALDTEIVSDTEVSAEYSTCLPGNFVRLSIQDTGCGMADDLLSKIFEPFYTSKGVGEGTGMGLSTVQGMIKQLGGQIKVSSTLGHGSTFALYFPMLDSIHVEEPLAENTLLPRGIEHILFVDDEEMLAKLGETLLREVGYQVTAMTDSRAALKKFTDNSENFDLVITDQTMPYLTGKELVGELKKVRPDIPTILCTGYSSKINEAEADNIGISAFMLKPLELAKLAQTVRRLLDAVARVKAH